MAKKEIKKVDEQFISLVDNTIITKTNCKLCQSEFRAEAEEIFEKRNSIKAVERFLIEKGEQISYLSIRNHLLKHYLGSQRLESVKEWLEDIDRYSHNKYDRRINLYGRIKAMRREFVLIAAETDGMPLDDRRRSADILKKLSDGISGLEDKVDEMDNELSPIEVLIENLQGILASKIKNTQNEEVKRAFLDLLNELADNMSGLLVEQK